MRVKCTELSVTFESDGRKIPALHQVSFETRSREFLSIVGPSGCGKTTLLRTLAGIIPPPPGTVEWIPAAGESSRRRLLVFQEKALFPWMTTLENAAFGLEMQGLAREERESRARELLGRFGLSGRERAYPHQLSVGMKQRVAVIRAFLSDPALLLMDEPFGALDAQTRLVLQQELLTLWEQNHKSVIFVTHDVDEALLLSDRVLVLSAQPGAVVAEFAVPFARPRFAGTALTEEFLALRKEIFRSLGMKAAEVVHAS